MFLWRISLYTSLSGIGAELESGRWHTRGPGKRMVYLAEHPAVALIENLVNLDGDPQFFPDTFQLLEISAPDKVTPTILTPTQLASIDPSDPVTTEALGDSWLAANSSALLRVPSIPSPESWNYLLNPLHPDATSLTIEWAKRITYDQRLFRLK